MGWLFGQNPNNKNLSDAVKLYVDAYLQLRKNTPNGNVNTASINSNLSRAIKVFIDKKRLKVAAQTTQAALNAGVSQTAAVNSGAAAAAAATPSASPNRVGNAAVEPLPASTPVPVVQEIRNAAANQHATNTGQPAPTRAESLFRQAARPLNVVAPPAPRISYANSARAFRNQTAARARALFSRPPLPRNIMVKVNGVNKNYNTINKKFKSPNVPPIYTVAKGRNGVYYASINKPQFNKWVTNTRNFETIRKWARNQSLNTLMRKLPPGVANQIPNLPQIINNKKAQLKVPGPNVGSAFQRARAANQVVNVKQIENSNVAIRKFLKNFNYNNRTLPAVARTLARQFQANSLRKVLTNRRNLNNKQMTLLRAAIGNNNLNSLVSHRLENN